ncbi:MAG: BspA family leucine-rich repeat surface protein [Maribacter sp.]|uniref:BspA family leucine-rich repeat surface protein n=1 Tax=Maribacter sp. TaxID=1897614 RepID=UPI00329A0011
MSKIYSKNPLFLVVVLFLLSFFNTVAQEAVFRINTGGVASDYNGEQFITDNYFDTGSTLDRPQTGLPEPYQSFRFSRSQQMGYDIPLTDGEYTIHLYFAELWFGATGGGSGGIGSRVFDVIIEGQLEEDNLDIFAEVGADAMLMKSYTVAVTGGILDIDFDSRDVVGGERHPVINAIEVFSNSIQTPRISIDPIADQSNEINDTVNVNVLASGGDSNAAFVYRISGQPLGISINETTGLISGMVDPSAVTGGPNNNGIHQVRVVVSKAGLEDASETFDWSISHSSCIWNSLSDANIERYEAVSQKIGDKLYVLGGFKPGILVVAETEIYDTTNDIWTLGALMPVPVTHTAAVAVGSDIWIIGGFAGDNPGVATNVVQIYDTLTDSWSVGPALPNAVGSGAAALNGNKIYFVGGLEPDRQTDVADHLVLDLQNIAAGWTLAAPMPNPRNHHSYISVNGLIYAIGGQYGHDGPKQDTKLVHAYDPNSDEWTRMADLARTRSHFKAATTIHNGKIIIVGGIDNGPIVNDISVYDPQLNLWSLLCTLDGEGLDEPSAQAFGDRLIVSGGRPIRDSNIMLKETKWLQLEASTSQAPIADTGQDQSITLPTNTATINGSGSDPDGGTVTFLWTQESGPSAALLSGVGTSTLTANNLIAGDYIFRLTVTDDENETNFDEVTITVNTEIVLPDFALRINAGGTAANYEGEDFIADQYHDTGNTLDRPQTGLPEPYQTFRFSRSQQMSYDIPLEDGEYIVNLYFAELWFGATGGGPGGVGSRVFDISIEGQLAEDDLDVFAEVGADAMLMKSHRVTVTGGVLNIDFNSTDAVGGERHPIINAIEILGVEPLDERPFITTWKTDNPGVSEDNQITIPTYPGETYNYSVDWGDGTIDSAVTEDITHTYSTPGTYEVSITGDFPRIYFYNEEVDRLKILSVKQWGDISWKSFGQAFFACYNMDVTTTDFPDFSNVSGLSGMFSSCESMVGNSSFENWDVSNITAMEYMFSNTPFNQNISNWDVSNVTYMDGMFQKSSFNQDISAWNMSRVSRLPFMFRNSAFNQPIGDWDLGNAGIMNSMFEGAIDFNQGLGNWNVASVTRMEDMFKNSALSLENYDNTLIGWSTQQIRNGVTFDGGNSQFCQGEEARQKLIDDFGWTITDAGKTSDCPDTSSFITTWKTDNPGISNDNQITIQTVSGEIYNYEIDWGDGTSDSGVNGNIVHTYTTPGVYQVSITGVFPRIDFHNTSDGINEREKILSIDQWGDIAWSSMENAFVACSNLDVLATDIPNFSSVTSTRAMFGGCASLIGNESMSNWNVSTILDMQGMFSSTTVFNQDIGGWDVSNVRNMLGMFNGASSFNQDIGDWNVGNVQNMRVMFAAASSFNKDVSRWDVSKVFDMGSMFSNAKEFNQQIGLWNVSSVTNMSWMFSGASKFNQDLNGWNVGNVQDMKYMFQGTMFNKDIGQWNVGQVNDMTNMFRLNTSFNQDIGNWDVSSVTTMNSMFYEVPTFDQDLSNWNVANVVDMRNMFIRAGLSNANYDSTLQGWNSLPSLQEGVEFTASFSQYCLGAAARQNLIDQYGWIIFDAGENCTTVPDGIWLEAECAIVGDNWSVVNDADASGGQYLLPPAGFNSFPTSDAKSIVSFNVPITEAGIYSIFVLLNAPTSSNDSFWIRINGNGWLRWNNIPKSTEFEWNQIHDREIVSAPLTFDLEIGVNTVEFGHRETSVGLDKIHVTNTASVPVGLGEADETCNSSSSGKRAITNSTTLSPNPAGTTTILSFEKPVELTTIQVFDTMGRLVHTYSGPEVAEDDAYLLNVNLLPTGTYFIKSQDTHGEHYQKQMVIKK